MKNKTLDYLFSWDCVPGEDSERLIRFLRKDFDIEWVVNSKIYKSDDGKTIKISEDENSAEITIDEKGKKATLKIPDVRTIDLKVKEENGKLNIYTSDYFGSGYAVDMYHILEKDLLKFLEYMPLYVYDAPQKREKIHSPKLAELLVRIGYNIDIFLKHLMEKRNLESDVIQRYNAESKRPILSIRTWNMGKYKLGEPELRLNDEWVKQIFEGKIYPFKDRNSKTPKWWTAYNKIKHDGYDKKERGHLENVLNALAGFFILICKFNHISHKMLYYDYLAVNPQFYRDILKMGKAERGHMRHTRLFIYPKDS